MVDIISCLVLKEPVMIQYRGNAETPVLPVPVVAGDALVALAVPVDAGQPATAGVHNHAHQAVATRRGLEEYLDK